MINIELPELSGTEKQIKWAVDLRNKFIKKYQKVRFLTSYEIRYCNKLKEMLNADDTSFDKEFIKYFVDSKLKSTFWIDTRYYISYSDYKNRKSLYIQAIDKIKEQYSDELTEEALEVQQEYIKELNENENFFKNFIKMKQSA